MRKTTIFLFLIVISGCTGIPKGIVPVDEFNVDRYLGKWYEIARLNHSFERGMDHVTATYSMRDDGGVKVLNRGFLSKESQWKEAEGKAYFVKDKTTGHLKVSFFGPFYGSYIIYELDKEDYQYAFIASYNHSYLWLLSRTPEVSEQLIQRFESQAIQLGFNLDELVYPQHN